ncbi:DNA mismatch repair endonuclease MutL [Candidatus Haliotispira prima]|uniref:DNA mismatch repair protein MutL n=1 Tax=Candidatus Haliotispira prima TaxID=3034016 RepID=A0ABY8MJD5_9SPIO|nr:DNA mismatch repair endonuclease MutL [Candidatus Haliotispira prima]
MSQNIAILDPQVAAKIAAGEVIERPSAVVRELLDNAIDAGATQISLYLEEGGLQLIRVTDDGFGMSREDLELCYLPHATSKIRQTNDLLQLCSLGFRGEALGSVAACSKLRISSAQEISEVSDVSAKLKAHELRIADSLFQDLQEVSAAHSGTQVEVRELFYSFPARRKFLKSVRAELNHCKAVFQEKALAFPHIYFRLYNNSKMELSLSPGSAPERICQIYGDLAPEQLFSLSERAGHFSLELFAASPALYRRDRKRMPIYINQRPISEASLQQAVRIGFDGYLAGGLFPICFCFLEVDPERVDFNIHPAKREARLRDLSLIQSGIRQTLRSFCRETGKLSHGSLPETANAGEPTRANSPEIGRAQDRDQNRGTRAGSAPQRHSSANFSRIFEPPEKGRKGQAPPVGEQSFSARDLLGNGRSPETSEPFEGDSLREDYRNDIPAAASGPKSGRSADLSGFSWSTESIELRGKQPFRYLGRIFEVFLLVECEMDGVEQLLIVDQHAGHERLLYETLEREMLQKQPLLVPITFEADETEQESLRRRSPALASIGIQVEEVESERGSYGTCSSWQISGLPPSVGDLKEELIELVRNGASEAEDLKRELFAHLSCRKAIKKGDVLDDISANKLLDSLFSMGLERCPHGRPVWYSISKQELYRLLQRT